MSVRGERERERETIVRLAFGIYRTREYVSRACACASLERLG